VEQAGEILLAIENLADANHKTARDVEGFVSIVAQLVFVEDSENKHLIL